MNYPIKCPHCWLVIDSMDSYADTKQDLRYHILYKHPGEDVDSETNHVGDRNNSDSSDRVYPTL
jgi:hypothetical protein